MKPKSYLLTTAILVICFGGWVFLWRREPAMPYTVGGTALMLLFFLAMSAIRPATDFFASNERTLRISGYALAALGFLGIAGPLLATFVNRDFADRLIASMDSKVTIGVLVASMVVGLSIAQVGKSAKKIIAVRDIPNPAAKSDHPSFPWLAEALNSNRYVLRHGKAFLAIIGPWVAIGTLLPVLVLQFTALNDGAISGLLDPVHSMPKTHLFFVALFSAFFQSFAVSIAAVAWIRFVLLGRYPGSYIALPDRFAWRLLFGILVFNSMTNKLSAAITPDLSALAGYFGIPTRVAVDILQTGIQFLALSLMSVLVLPYVAKVAEHNNTTIPTVTRRAFGFGFGLVIALAPGWIASAAIEHIFSRCADPSLSVQQLLFLVPAIFSYSGLAAAATYLARGYQAATGLPASTTTGMAQSGAA